MAITYDGPEPTHRQNSAALGPDHDLIIYCFRPGCPRPKRTMAPAEAVQLVGDLTVRQADQKLTCTACGAKGRDGFVQARWSTIPRDWYEREHGPPYGPLPQFGAPMTLVLDPKAAGLG